MCADDTPERLCPAPDHDAYPWYGWGPGHREGRYIPPEEWPPNFEPDPESSPPGQIPMGSWKCPSCMGLLP